MRCAVLSDIHSNLEAFQTVLEYLEKQNIPRIICLGDIIGYGPRPNECIELVRKHCDVCLMGNHDHATLGLTDIYYFNQYAKDAVLWTRREVVAENKVFLESLPFVVQEDPIIYAHSTPVNPQDWQYIFSEQEALYNLEHIEQKLAFIGHSHIPIVFSRENGVYREQKIQLDMETDSYIINVGSVGQPRDGDPRACLVIYDAEEATIEYVRLEYPVQETYQQILDCKLPSFLGMRLLAGQ